MSGPRRHGGLVLWVDRRLGGEEVLCEVVVFDVRVHRDSVVTHAVEDAGLVLEFELKNFEVRVARAYGLDFSVEKLPPLEARPPVLGDGHREIEKGVREFRVDIEGRGGGCRHGADDWVGSGRVEQRRQKNGGACNDCMHRQPSPTPKT